METDIQTSFRLSEELRLIVHERIAYLPIRFPEISKRRITVHLRIEPLERVAEIVLSVSGKVLFSKSASDNFDSAVKESAAQISQQLENLTVQSEIIPL